MFLFFRSLLTFLVHVVLIYSLWTYLRSTLFLVHLSAYILKLGGRDLEALGYHASVVVDIITREEVNYILKLSFIFCVK